MNELVTITLTEIQQEKVQNLVRRVKRADKRRMEDMRVEVGVKDSFKKKLVSRRLTWAGHVERMGDEKLTKRTDVQKMDGEGGEEDRNCDGDCIKRDVERMGEECRKRAADRRHGDC